MEDHLKSLIDKKERMMDHMQRLKESKEKINQTTSFLSSLSLNNQINNDQNNME